MPIDYRPMEAGMPSFQAHPEIGSPIASGETDQPSQYPKSLLDLPYTGTLSSLMEARIAAQMGIPVAGIDLTAGRSIFIQQFQRYAWVKDGNEQLMFGVAVRWLVEIQKMDMQAKVSSLPMLAASAQLGFVNATVRFDVIGMISREIDAAIPAPTVLSVETHAEYAGALKTITGLMWQGDSVTIRPQPLSVGVDRLGSISHEVLEAWVYYKICAGCSLRKLLDEVLDPTPGVKQRVEELYREIVSPGSEDAAPTDETKQLIGAKFQHFKFK